MSSEQQISLDGQMRKKREVLGNITNRSMFNRHMNAASCIREHRSIHFDPCGMGSPDSGNDFKKRGFPAAGWSEDPRNPFADLLRFHFQLKSRKHEPHIS